MARYTKREFTVGPYWLSQRAGSPAFYRTWVEAGRSKRVSLATDDIEEAKRRLTTWFIANVRPESAPPKAIPLADVLLSHWERHAKKQRSKSTQKMAINYWNEFFGECSVDEATSKAKRDAFVEFLEAKGLKPSSVSRVISVGKAAIRAAWENRELDRLLPFKDVHVDQEEKEPRGRPLDVDEIRLLLSKAKHEHLRRFILLLCATAARPEALLELKWSQIDLSTGVILLNAPGRKQTTKRRPRLRVGETARNLLVEWHGKGGGLIEWEGEAVQSVKKAWRTLRTDCKLDMKVNPTSFRHTVARLLRGSGVAPYEVSAFLAHKLPGMTITDIYAVADPLYMQSSREVVEKLLRAILAPENKTRELEKANNIICMGG